MTKLSLTAGGLETNSSTYVKVELRRKISREPGERGEEREGFLSLSLSSSGSLRFREHPFFGHKSPSREIWTSYHFTVWKQFNFLWNSEGQYVVKMYSLVANNFLVC